MPHFVPHNTKYPDKIYLDTKYHNIKYPLPGTDQFARNVVVNLTWNTCYYLEPNVYLAVSSPISKLNLTGGRPDS
jgi:hypothetical protein